MSVNGYAKAKTTGADLFHVSPALQQPRGQANPPIEQVKLVEKLNSALRSVGYREEVSIME